MRFKPAVENPSPSLVREDLVHKTKRLLMIPSESVFAKPGNCAEPAGDEALFFVERIVKVKDQDHAAPDQREGEPVLPHR